MLVKQNPPFSVFTIRSTIRGKEIHMKRHIIIVLVFLAFAVMAPVASNAEVNVSISVPLPPLVIPAPPALVVIPGTYVYYPPDVATDIFFYQGYWYRPYGGRWYRAVRYNGPWITTGVGRVPRAVIGVPVGFRHRPVIHERVPYHHVRKHWRTWERDRHWDRHEKREFRGPHEGHGRAHGPGMHQH